MRFPGDDSGRTTPGSQIPKVDADWQRRADPGQMPRGTQTDGVAPRRAAVALERAVLVEWGDGWH